MSDRAICNKGVAHNPNNRMHSASLIHVKERPRKAQTAKPSAVRSQRLCLIARKLCRGFKVGQNKRHCQGLSNRPSRHDKGGFRSGNGKHTPAALVLQRPFAAMEPPGVYLSSQPVGILEHAAQVRDL